MRSSTAVLALGLAVGGPPVLAGERGPAEHGGIEVGTGFRGSLSFASASYLLPRFVPHMQIGLGGVAMSATNWVTFTDHDTGETSCVHPVVVGGLLAVGGGGDIVHDFMRNYGGFELLLGTTLTPYDDAFYGTDNLVGANTTIGIWATYGIEFLVGEHQAIYVDGGGGFKTLRGVDRSNPYAVAAGWVGSGFLVETGTRIYF